jgi:PhzF family phenazine biosynthesis protein
MTREQRRSPGHVGEIDSPAHPVRAWIYSSFADGPRGGNPAGVVLSPAPLATEEAQAVATALNLPTTGFVTEPARRVASVDIRFFTPAEEIAACGHVTIATAAALVETGIWQWGDKVIVNALGGEFPLALRTGVFEMTQQLRVLTEAPVEWPEVEAALGNTKRHPMLTLAISGTGLRHLIVPLASTTQLNQLELDANRIATLASRAGADTICVWAPVNGGRVRVRDLCAGIGALEEPASGTTSAALALYLTATGWMTTEMLVVEQGIEMRRPSRIDVTVLSPNIATVRGRARKVLSGTLEW